jgi:dolichol-phosphate mannosyltransferase
MKFSVIVPVFNEEDNIPPLVAELVAMASGREVAEILLVDDGSRDRTWTLIERAEAEHAVIKGLRHERNLGQTAAMLNGLCQASGEVLVTMDGDLQNNPADIPTLVEALEREGVDVVCGFRAKRRDSWSKRAASRLGNAIRNRVTRDGLIDTGCSLKAFRRACRDDLPPLDGAHRFMGAYFKLHGRSMKQIPVDHRPRRHGVSKYTNLKRLPRTAFDLLGFVWYRRRYLHP